MTLAIHELERSAQRDRSAIDRFLEAHEFPIVEGRTATFVYTGSADAVFLRHWIHGLSSTIRDTLHVDPLTCETGIPGVFAGGDAVSGPATVIHAPKKIRSVASGVRSTTRRSGTRRCVR